MSLNTNSEAVLALEKILKLVERFLEKIPIRDYGKNVNRLLKKTRKLAGLKYEEDRVKIYNNIIKTLKTLLSRELHQQIFYIVGAHGGIIINEIPFCEFDSPDYAFNKLVNKMKLAFNSKVPFNLEIAVCCLKWLKDNSSNKFELFKKLMDQGKFEIINPTYSQPYLLMLGEESNIKQFEIGLRTLKDLDLKTNIYYASEFSVHPQIPQLLKSFGIRYSSLRSRLLGCSPTSHSSVISWIGLDGTKVDALINQTGIFDGEYFHGMFYHEIPHLLFQVVSKPYMKNALFSNLEDFIMPQPFQNEIWNVSKHNELFGKFLLSSEVFEYIKQEGCFKYSRDEFILGDYVFYTPELLFQNNQTELLLILVEILNCVSNSNLPKNISEDLEDLWKKFLITQAHDSYAVPFIRSGDYSRVQLSNEEVKKANLIEDSLAISEVSIELLKDIQQQLLFHIESSLKELAHIDIKEKAEDKLSFRSLILFNPSPHKRKDKAIVKCTLNAEKKYFLFDGQHKIPCVYSNNLLTFIAEIWSLNHKIYSILEDSSDLSDKRGEFLYTIQINHETNSLNIEFNKKVVFTLKFNAKFPYELSFQSKEVNSIVKREIITITTQNSNSKLQLYQYSGINRLECKLNSNGLEGLRIKPQLDINKTYVNYPFGIEQTFRQEIQSLDFVWLKENKKGILFVQKNSPQFKINSRPCELLNKFHRSGRYEFAFSITESDDLSSIRKIVDEYKYNILGFYSEEPVTLKNEERDTLILDPYVPVVNLWRRNNANYIRVFNPSGKNKSVRIEGTLIKKPLEEITLEGKLVSKFSNNTVSIKPWQIKTLRF